MDRWADADDGMARSRARGPQGRVAREGIGAFVKADQLAAPAEQPSYGQIQVVQSRRHQQQQAAMPPPAPHQAAAAAPPAYMPPAWAGNPPAGAQLHITKGTELVQTVQLDKAATLFGRSVAADMMLEHPSSSRQHAAICYRPGMQQWVCLDLGSAHGTFINGHKLQKGVPHPLQPSDTLTFGASSRSYRLVLPDSSRKRHAEDLLQHDGSKTSKPAAGRFANLVHTEVIPKAAAAQQKPAHVKDSPAARNQPQFHKFIDQHLKRPPVSPLGSLYDELPPETH